MLPFDRAAKVYVAGHRGMVGSAIVRKLRTEGFENLLLPPRSELDLLDQHAVNNFFRLNKPEFVFLAAAKVGGIHANRSAPSEFLYENLMIGANVIHAALEHGTEKLLFLGSSCIYPKMAPQPLKEEYLLTGPLEPTNEAYALAKITSLKLCEFINRQHGRRFISAMPTNLYGPNDNYDPMNSHVIPGLIRRIHEAKLTNAPEVKIWGTGTPRREFLHVDDLAAALFVLMKSYEDGATINVGTGEDISIRELANLIAQVVDYRGALVFDPSMPDGTPRKVLDISRAMSLGWRPEIPLSAGIAKTYADFLSSSSHELL